MKLNWGTGIVLGMASFMAFILYMVITMSTNKNFSHDLVTEDYYAKEMVYQEEIDAETNTNNLSEKIRSQKVEGGWEIIFPKQMEPSKIKGSLFLYRPSNEKLDSEIALNLTESNILIPASKFLDGRWNIIISWEYEGEEYMYKEEIVY